MNTKCIYCGNIINRTDSHCQGCGAVAASTFASTKEPTEDYDYDFACKSVEGYKIEVINNSDVRVSADSDSNIMNKEHLGLKQIAFHIKFVNLGKKPMSLFFCNEFNANNENEELLPIKLYADGELVEDSSVGPIDSTCFKEADGKVFSALGRLVHGFIYTLECDPGTNMEGWIGFYVPFKAHELKLIIGTKQIVMNNPFYTE